MAGENKINGLTAMQAKYVRAYGRTGDAELSAMLAGYSQPDSAAVKLQQNPVVQGAAESQLRSYLDGHLAPKVLMKIDSDLDLPQGDPDRRNAINLVMKYTFGSWDKRDAASGEKAIHEQSASELQATLDRLEARRAELAGMAIDVTPDPEESGVFG